MPQNSSTNKKKHDNPPNCCRSYSKTHKTFDQSSFFWRGYIKVYISLNFAFMFFLPVRQRAEAAQGLPGKPQINHQTNVNNPKITYISQQALIGKSASQICNEHVKILQQIQLRNQTPYLFRINQLFFLSKTQILTTATLQNQGKS